jgi:hypothetical protein
VTKYDENGKAKGTPYLSDLGPALKTAIHRDKHWDSPIADISNGYWEEEGKVPDAMLRNTNKAKTGQLWHKGKAYLWKMPYMRGDPVTTDNLCPMCSQPDSGSHILGGFAHPEMKKMVIYRHHEAHRIIVNAINKSRKGAVSLLQT